MIVVMTVTGILVSVVALFIRRPMEGLVDATRRAALADTADTAARRMRRDIQRALPNSVRFTNNGATQVIEFLPTISGGRYCTDSTTTIPACAPLNFACTPGDPLNPCSTSFSYLCTPSVVGSCIDTSPGFSAAQVAEVSVYNLGIPGADAYSSDNTTAFVSVAGQTVTMSSKKFPFSSPGNRFQLIGSPVSYVCSQGTAAGSGTGTLRRVSGYAKQASQPPNPAALPNAVSNLLASNVEDCRVDYAQSAIDQYGLLYLTLKITQSNESVNLSHAIQINNTP